MRSYGGTGKVPGQTIAHRIDPPEALLLLGEPFPAQHPCGAALATARLRFVPPRQG